ncbi:glycerol-3-phosphate acyltransferase [Sporosarcina ureae]|uniref:glycerol-3-phosphate acyltransferase n=1 Tax=Sporosarcina ureae TaxID=1571 RepID=UPI0026EBC335|nr:glycerol-3-phosphate acyltransferase [Sporosarcina ureae]
MLQLIIFFIIWYLVGSILPALYVGKSKGLDLRAEGSGNPGARNAGRVLGKSMFFVVLFLDAMKGALPIMVMRALGFSPAIMLLMLFAVILGHCFPLFHRLRGGKGAASLLGGMIVFQPLVLLLTLIFSGLLYSWIRKKTKAAVLGLSAIIPAVFIGYGEWAGIVAICLVALVIYTHRSYFII